MYFLPEIFLLFLFTVRIYSEHVIVCYYTNWSQYRLEDGKFNVENIDPELCTHIIYAFFKIETDFYKLKNSEWNDDAKIKEISLLKEKNANLKLLIGVGGWNHEKFESPFSEMVHHKPYRASFVRSVVSFLKEKDFDGLDLDWEYPGRRNYSRPDDKSKFTILCKELREAFEKETKPYLLTSSVSVAKIDVSYEVSKISEYLDFVSLLSYDLYGNWNSFTGHHTNLDRNANYNVYKGVESWLNKGMPADKIVLGLAMYGQTFTLADKKRNTLYSNTTGPGLPNTFTNAAGLIAYYEVCWTLWDSIVFDKDTRAPYSYKGNQWVSYDDEESLVTKVNELVVPYNLKGIMIWALDLDDFSGNICGDGTYPLIRAAKKALQKSNFKSVSVIETKQSRSEYLIHSTPSSYNAMTAIKATAVPIDKKSINAAKHLVSASEININDPSSTVSRDNYQVLSPIISSDNSLISQKSSIRLYTSINPTSARTTKLLDRTTVTNVSWSLTSLTDIQTSMALSDSKRTTSYVKEMSILKTSAISTKFHQFSTRHYAPSMSTRGVRQIEASIIEPSGATHLPFNKIAAFSSNYLSTTHSNDYLPATHSNDYTPATHNNDYTPATHSNDYTPATHSNDYTPATHNNDYTPATHNNDYTPATYSNDYTPAQPTEALRLTNAMSSKLYTWQAVEATRNSIAPSSKIESIPNTSSIDANSTSLNLSANVVVIVTLQILFFMMKLY